MKENSFNLKKIQNQTTTPLLPTPEQSDPPLYPIPQQKDSIQPSIPPEPQQPPVPPMPSEPRKKGVFYGLILFILTGLIVLGYLMFTKGNLKLSLFKPTPQPTPPVSESTPTPTPDPTADWKTYTNDEFGFEFKYPGDWGIKIAEDWEPGFRFLAVYSPENVTNPYDQIIEGEVFAITIHDKSSETLDSLINNIKEWSSVEIQKPAHIQSHSYFLAEDPPYRNSTDKILIIEKGNYIYLDELVWSKNKPESEILLDQILSTFKFSGTSNINNGSVLVDCPNVQQSSELTYLQSYLLGDQCSFDTKNDCESTDVVSLDNNQLSENWSQDGIPDCIWHEESNATKKCTPKYLCKK